MSSLTAAALLPRSKRCTTESPIVHQHVDHHLMHALPKEHSFSQGPLPLGLDHLAAGSSHGIELRSSASPTGIRPPYSWLLPWSTASLKDLSHWDSATLRFAPSHGAELRSSASLTGIGRLAAGFFYGTQLHSMASSTRTRPLCDLLFPWSTASPKGLSHWDSANHKKQGPPPT
ncbi:hypothetical protein Adt_10185 [Abeliophyllum distichum]|uniref:Uncharacterized protein n=1 Tax=Abeliophyllum distichum TaxID=126358 RepID=A0ABD1UJA6_9LAMI